MSCPVSPFSLAALPAIEFGAGALERLPAMAAGFGRHLLLITGAASFTRSAPGERLLALLAQQGFNVEIRRVREEPSPAWVDQTVAELRGRDFDVVVGIGGGSPLDAAKAVAGLLKPGNSIMDHLEGVGPELPYQGPATPFIAVPTTAGTGSEATRNAVLSVSGPQGFKKSFRDAQLMARVAIVDPDLLAACPPAQIAGNGMDAFTQLLESYVSTRSNPLTEALALSGMAAVRDGLPAFYNNPDNAEARSRMAYAALLSGICLAQTGLGSVHGIVAPLGAFHSVPHGVGCGMLVTEATRMNISLLEEREPDHPVLARYNRVGSLLRDRNRPLEADSARMFIVHTLLVWARELNLPRLSDYGVTEADIPALVAHSRGSSMKTNPVVLSDDDIAEVIRGSL
ncbi:MAG: iron-containing alcohol dehydrogenase [Thiothrix sp.]|nr:iron-containing alcohol dehydrogenase [Thiothrix sp.]